MRRRIIQSLFQMAELLASMPGGRRLPRPGQMLMLTAHTPDISDYACLADANKRAYAARHGYRFCSIHAGFDPSRPPAWSKIRFIQRALLTHRWVFWTDADSLVMNPDFRLQDLIQPGKDIVLTEAPIPYRHINTGQMLFRSCPFSLLFLEAVWRMTAFIHDSAWEQRAVNHLLENYRLKRVHIVPNHVCNAFGGVPDDPRPYQPGDFIIHFPGVPDKLQRMRELTANPSHAN